MSMGLVVALAACLIAAPMVGAKTKSTHKVSCKQIKDTMASGKSAEDTAKELNVSEKTVKGCTAPAHPHHHKTTAKKTT